MKETKHNDPFEYSSFKNDSFWDFSWENDKWTIIEIAAVVVFCAWVINVIK